MKLKLLALLVAGIVASPALWAEGATKVVVLDLRAAIMMSDAAKEKMKALESQKEYAEVQKKAESLRQQLLKKQEELQKEGATWNADKRNNHLKDMDFMRKDFELAAQKLRAEQERVMRELMQEMESRVKQVLEQIIKEQQIGMVVDKNATLFSERSMDITEQVVAQLNKRK